MKSLELAQMENLQGGKSWCSENTALAFAGIAVGAVLAGSVVASWAGAALLYSCVVVK